MNRTLTAPARTRPKGGRMVHIRAALARGVGRLRRAARLFGMLPTGARVALVVAVLALVWAATNWVVQAWRKPTEMLFPVGQALVKSPSATWREYGPLFREHSTPVITAELLAALAQIEGAGNPVARPEWTWRWSRNPFEWYRPASSAVGMFQITDAAFRDARRYCIHDHTVAEDGPWYDWSTCWFNGLYTRVLPGHAIEMTSALLHRSVVEVLSRRGGVKATLSQKQELAAVIHLCGLAKGDAFARKGFQVDLGERCGRQNLRSYLLQMETLRQRFGALAALDR